MKQHSDAYHTELDGFLHTRPPTRAPPGSAGGNINEDYDIPQADNDNISGLPGPYFKYHSVIDGKMCFFLPEAILILC